VSVDTKMRQAVMAAACCLLVPYLGSLWDSCPSFLCRGSSALKLGTAALHGEIIRSLGADMGRQAIEHKSMQWNCVLNVHIP
jgi:hypothetical protein